ncbi:MAG: NAD(+) diphosphatase [Cellvibrionaceae bacterium]
MSRFKPGFSSKLASVYLKDLSEEKKQATHLEASLKAPSDALYVVLVDEYQVLMSEGSEWQPMDHFTWQFSGLEPIEQHHIGYYDNHPCFAVKVSHQSQLPAGYRWEAVRNLLIRNAITESHFEMIGSGMQIFNWDSSHQFCGKCGSKTKYHGEERARVCEPCGLHYYPRLSPCVIVLITKGEECLLAKHARGKAEFYSPLAGFIEPGETVENALRREVAEEVAVSVKNLQYFASQPWPYPGQLMIGFYAEYDSGDIEVDGIEIIDAKWFHYSDLPSIPAAGSLSGKLISQFVAKCAEKD